MKSIRWLALALVLAPVGAWRAMAGEPPIAKAADRTEEAWKVVRKLIADRATSGGFAREWEHRASLSRTDVFAKYCLETSAKFEETEARRASELSVAWPSLEGNFVLQLNSIHAISHTNLLDIKDELMAAQTEKAAQYLIDKDSAPSSVDLSAVREKDWENLHAAFLAGK